LSYLTTRRIAEQSGKFELMELRNLPTEARAEVFRAGKFAKEFIPLRGDDTKDQRLQLSQMFIALGEIDTEMVPSVRVTISQMVG
jgi:hypothetical protein